MEFPKQLKGDSFFFYLKKKKLLTYTECFHSGHYAFHVLSHLILKATSVVSRVKSPFFKKIKKNPLLLQK